MKPIRRLIVEAHRRSLWQVFTVYVAVSWGGYQIIDALPGLIGVPDWVPGMAVVLFLIGLPIVLATAFVQEGVPTGRQGERGAADADRASDREDTPASAAVSAGPDPGPTSPPSPEPSSLPLSHRLFTWKRSMIGAGLALLLLTTSAGGYMGMRLMGVGPAASLRASGALAEDDILILADFGNATSDGTLADVITEALRIDLASSRGLKIAEPVLIEDALARMQRPATSRIDRELAHEIAEREALKAVIAGDVGALGSRYVLTAEIFSAADRSVIASFRETARDADDLLAATDRLSRRIRAKAGESLRSVNASPGLERVTTRSLPALRKYTEAERAGGGRASRELLAEAIALDSTFAMAYRKLGALLNNAALRQESVEARTMAFRLRANMTAVERALTEADYYSQVERDRERALRAYREALSIDPLLIPARNNAAFMLNDMGRFAEAESMAVGIDMPLPLAHLAEAQFAQGRFDAVLETATRWRALFPEAGAPDVIHRNVALVRADYATLDSLAAVYEQRDDPRPGFAWREELALLRGQLAAAAAYRERRRTATLARGSTPGLPATWMVIEDALHGLDPAPGLQLLDSIAAVWDARDAPVLDMPLETVGYAYAVLGRLDRAREYLGRAEARLRDEVGANPFTFTLPALRARVALAEGRPDEALQFLRAAEPPCDICIDYEVGTLFDHAGQADSAVVRFERFVNEPRRTEYRFQIGRRSLVMLRLAELYDQRGNAAKAAEYYARLLTLWQDADPHLQPRVEAAQRRLAELVVER
jgi:eukaryotic-like serine/threonine-protein kinase